MGYNGLGDLDYTLDFKNRKADYVYDYDIANDTDLGLLRRVDYYAAGAGTPNDTVSYTYDAFGRRDVATETLGGDSRVTDTDYDGEGRVTHVLNADGEIHYGYNLLGQQTQMWTGSSSTFLGGTTGVEYQYDAFGRLRSSAKFAATAPRSLIRSKPAMPSTTRCARERDGFARRDRSAAHRLRIRSSAWLADPDDQPHDGRRHDPFGFLLHSACGWADSG